MDKFKNRVGCNADFEQYKELTIRHDNDLHADNSDRAKIMKLMICICRVSLCREKRTISLARVRLGRAERLESPGGHGQRYVKAVSLLSKGNWNKSNERKHTFTF